MSATLKFSNCSLKKTLNSVDNPITKAKITVFYYLFLFNFLKFAAVLPGYIATNNKMQIIDCAIGSVITLTILKLLLWKTEYLDKLIFFVLTLSLVSEWSFIFINNNPPNLINVQNVLMIVMWSFYGLKGNWGYLYSGVAIIPMLSVIIFESHPQLQIGLPNVPIYSSLIIIVLNFVIIVLAHFFYRSILYQTIASSDKVNCELKEASEMNNLFFSTMSHELRTPLNAVIGMANLLKVDDKDKEQKENLDILKFSAESLLSLINDVLDFKKMGSGKMALEKISFNLKELLEKSCAGLRIRANEKNLYCKTIIDTEIEAFDIIGDPTRLQQIIYNLVGNAIKFTDKGGVTIQVKILHSFDDVISLRFIIQDTGLGISAEQQQIIFEPFTQASANTNRTYGGTGLGLSIVKHLLTLHQSSINVTSEMNTGATFSFDIAYKIEKRKTPNIVQPEVEKRGTSLSNLKVLMAEDNNINILLMKKLFSRWGISLDVAENGEQAVGFVANNDYDIILMDLQMPVMDGYDATLKIRAMEDKIKSSTYIMALTASMSSDVQIKILDVGMNDFLSKPFPPNELYHKLEELAVSIPLRTRTRTTKTPPPLLSIHPGSFD